MTEAQYIARVQETLDRCRAASVGTCEGCLECAAELGGDLNDEGCFSWSACGICGCTLGGDRYIWHWLDEDNELMHERDACTDCVFYMANGDLPEGLDPPE